MNAEELMLSNCGAENTPESPLGSKGIKEVNPKGNQPWTFIGRTDEEAEAPILWPHVVKSLLIGKDPNAGKDWRQEEKPAAEDPIGRHQRIWLDGITNSMNMNLRKCWEIVKHSKCWHAATHGITRPGHDLETTTMRI